MPKIDQGFSLVGTELTGANGGPIETRSLSHLSDDELVRATISEAESYLGGPLPGDPAAQAGLDLGGEAEAADAGGRLDNLADTGGTGLG